MQPITIRSRALRKKQTPAEEVVWRRLRNRALRLKFVRQKPILIDYFGRKRAFVADFYCSECRRIIEIDGRIHSKYADYDTHT
jgi:very-short-patch-repair endonuclease